MKLIIIKTESPTVCRAFADRLALAGFHRLDRLSQVRMFRQLSEIEDGRGEPIAIQRLNLFEQVSAGRWAILSSHNPSAYGGCIDQPGTMSVEVISAEHLKSASVLARIHSLADEQERQLRQFPIIRWLSSWFSRGKRSWAWN
ncbi:hypothetical protein [Reinekea blandensis]|uniref:Uncharacterized protein n=1 Tax=Reinekea blandensis MED297 TaxID=314283 RepID=A4BHP8_9GAMM|nr:hypothetical protein [Reinekea blandensis]EAR08303.1 hypothetical protein MED297_09191 [Reinekea sp. MED297] [Reinekea blandensis MED297]